MLMPKKVKYRKQFKKSKAGKGKAEQGNYVAFGEFGLKATTASWVQPKQIEAARKVLTRATKKGGKLWIRVFPDQAVTKHGEKQGGGKGAPDYFVYNVRPGRILFELAGVPEDIAREHMYQAGFKLPVQTTVVTRD